METFPVPEAALREAVLNAIIHKDYGAGTPIQISVYPNKIMIWNAGELPPDWTVAKLKDKHPSQPFNPDVANVFFRAGKIEAWGRGIARILEACDAAGLPEPDIRHEPTGLWFEFHFSEQQMWGTTQESTQESTQEKILALLRSNPSITRKAIAVKLGLSDDGIKYHLGKLKSAGIIRHVGSTKAGLWEILK